MEVESVEKSENEFSNYVSSNSKQTAKATERPLTEEEMRNCKHCNYQAPDWPMFAIHVLKPSHVKKVAEAMKVRVAGGPIRNTGNLHNKKPYDRRPQPLIGLEYVTETVRGRKIQWYHCSVCDAKFDDNMKFPHLVGRRHRLNVLKVKRPAVVEGIHPKGKKRSEVTPILLREAKKLEDEEGKQKLGRGAKRGRGSNRGTRGTMRGGRGNRGMSNTRGRGNNTGQYSTQARHDNYSTYNEPYGNNSCSSNLSYNSAYNASFDNPDSGRNYQQSYDSGQSQYGSGQSYSTSGQNIPSGGSEARTAVNCNLAAALIDLTKLIQSEEDALVALRCFDEVADKIQNDRTGMNINKSTFGDVATY